MYAPLPWGILSGGRVAHLANKNEDVSRHSFFFSKLGWSPSLFLKLRFCVIFLILGGFVSFQPKCQYKCWYLGLYIACTWWWGINVGFFRPYTGKLRSELTRWDSLTTSVVFFRGYVRYGLLNFCKSCKIDRPNSCMHYFSDENCHVIHTSILLNNEILHSLNVSHSQAFCFHHLGQ